MVQNALKSPQMSKLRRYLMDSDQAGDGGGKNGGEGGLCPLPLPVKSETTSSHWAGDQSLVLGGGPEVVGGSMPGILRWVEQAHAVLSGVTKEPRISPAHSGDHSNGDDSPLSTFQTGSQTEGTCRGPKWIRNQVIWGKTWGHSSSGPCSAYRNLMSARLDTALQGLKSCWRRLIQEEIHTLHRA